MFSVFVNTKYLNECSVFRPSKVHKDIKIKTQNVEVETIGHRYHKRQKLVSIEFMNFMEVLQLNQKGIFNLCNIDQRSDHEYLADL